MKRRGFITLLGAAVALPLPLYAQQPVIGFLRSTTVKPFENLAAAFREGLKEAGFVEGQNVAIEYRYAENKLDRLPGLVADLIGRPVAVIVGDTLSAIPAKAATTTVPIVFASGGDPVRSGLVASLNRPGGNVTGVVFFGAALGAKRLDLVRQIMPKATTIAMLVDPNSPSTEAERTDVQLAADVVRQPLAVLDVSSDRDIETAVATVVQRGIGGLLVGGGTFLGSNRERIAALAAHHRLPAIYPQREAALAGGLMSYGPSTSDAYRQAGLYAGRILKGEKPADLPVIRSTKFEFVINLKTAKALELEIPATLLALSDEVIE
jgi:putative ABC transport system substrate-binding protein